MIHNIPISTGELLDRITILKLKTSVNTTKNNINQLATLMQLWIDIPLEERVKVDELIHKLFEINKKLWNLEDLVRSTKDDSVLLSSAKEIFLTNTLRNSIKKDIDKIMKSEFFEEKIYS